MYYSAFAVLDDPFCVWEHDLPDRNERFLASIDCEYFAFLAQTFLLTIESDDEQRGAVALRAAYHHGLETLFTLMGAMLQAPACVPGWIPRCSTRKLRGLVRRLDQGAPLITAAGTRRLGWSDVGSEVHRFAYQDETPRGRTAERFSRVWSRFADDFLDEGLTAEYNSIKHGLRVNAGGFVLRVGVEHEYGVAAPESEMETIGGSRYGTTFYVPERIPDGQTSHDDLHFRIRKRSLNWSLESLVGSLQLIGMSCNNIVSAIRALNGAAPGTLKYLRPVDPAAFDAPWTAPLGVTVSNMDLVVAETDIERFSREQVLTGIEARGRPRDA
jgi:hypothetical protein